MIQMSNSINRDNLHKTNCNCSLSDDNLPKSSQTLDNFTKGNQSGDNLFCDNIQKTAAKIRLGRLSASDLIAESLKKIQKNSDLNAVLWRDDSSATERANAVDSGKINGILAGIPIIIKDNIDVKGLPVTCGSAAFKNNIADKNAVVVDRLLSHGAVIVGKSNMDEFAMGSSNTTSAFGNVINPLDTSAVPGGSSGGSAASVAAGLCFASLGSDTGGSIRQPASYCGIVGLKPTYGSVCGIGCFPLAPSMDQIGPLARNVSDCALIYGAICDAGIDEFIDIKPAKGKIAVIKEALDAANELKNSSFGNNKKVRAVNNKCCDNSADTFDDYNATGAVKDTLMKAIDHLKASGCEVNIVSVPSFMKAHLIYKTLAFSEIAVTMRAVKCGRELLGKEVKKRIMAGRYALDHDKILAKAAVLRKQLTDEMNAALTGVDALLLPTAPSVAFKFNDGSERQEIEFSDMFTQPASIAGLPSLSVPFDTACGLPMGIQLVGKMYGEKTVFGIAKLLMNEE